MFKVKKCIIGGGLAGLSAGLAAGRDSLVIERDRLGGRCGSDVVDGVIFDYSTLYILSLNPCVKKIFKKIRVSKKLKKVNKKMLFYKNSKEYLFDFTDNFIIPLSFFEDNLEYKKFRDFVTAFSKIAYNCGNPFSSLNFLGHLSNRTINSFFRPISETFYLSPFDKIPPQLLFSLFKKFFIKKKQILICEGGFKEIINSLVKNYRGRIIFDEALKIREVGKKFEIITKQNRVLCDRAISAIPFPELKKLIDIPYNIKYNPANVLMLKNKDSQIDFLGSHLCFISDVDSPIVFFNDINLRFKQDTREQILYALVNPCFVGKINSKRAIDYLSDLLGCQLELVKEYYWKNGLTALDDNFIRFIIAPPPLAVEICGDSIGIGVKEVITAGYHVGHD